MDEQTLIQEYFTQTKQDKNLILGIGDDCAIVQSKPEHNIAISCDTMVENIHFTHTTPPQAIAHKLITCNISDLAAMGATPAWATLSISLPTADPKWLAQFSSTLKSLLNKYNLTLIGGDTTKSSIIMVSLTVHGFIAKQKELRMSTAKTGDLIYVTGTLGDSKLGLECLQGKQIPAAAKQQAIHKHYYPDPQLLFGQKLVGYATSCTDISDSLYQDLTALTKASQVSANIQIDQIPISDLLKKSYHSKIEALETAIIGGEDYELLFTINAKQEQEIKIIADYINIKISCIGTIKEGKKNNFYHNANKFNINKKNFEHFL